MDYDIKNYYFDLNGLHLRFINYNIPTFNPYSSEHPDAQQYINFKVSAKFDEPVPDYTDGEIAGYYDEVDVIPNFRGNPKIPVPAPGTYVDLYVSFTELNSSPSYNRLKKLIQWGYITSNIEVLYFNGIKLWSFYDDEGTGSGDKENLINYITQPDLPISIYRQVTDPYIDDGNENGNDDDNNTVSSGNNLLLWSGLALLIFGILGSKK